MILVDALAARLGGTAVAATEVAKRLGEDVTVVTRRGSLVEGGLRHTSVRVHVLPDVRRGELAHRLAWEALRLPRADAVLSWSGMLPRRVPGRLVCVLANPVLFTGGGAGNALRRAAVRRSAAGASAVVVPSEPMRALAEPLVGPVDVVPLGVDLAAFTPAAEPGSDVICVADFYAHKRHDLVLEAWAAVPEPRPRLRLIGDPRADPDNYRRVRAQAPRGVTFEHGLSRDELIAAYRAARVLVIASEQESFCLPLLEAQACGTPVLTRKALRSIAGPGARYVERDAEWVGALAELLHDDVEHAGARAAGLEHARTFTWERTAAALLERLQGAA